MNHWADSALVNGKAFNDTFGNPDATMVGVIVAIYESMSSFRAHGSLVWR